MAETLTLAIKGIWNAPNPFSAVPEGALQDAVNIVIDNDSVGQTRRGQSRYASAFAAVVKKLFQYRGTLIANYASALARDIGGTFTAYSGSFDAPSNTNRMRSFDSNNNFYITTSAGVKKLDAIDGTFVPAGSPQGLGGTYTLTSPGFMPDDTQVAYRIVWGYTDANMNEIVGAPSQRMIVVNETGATAKVVQTWQIPDDVTTTSWFYRVYRSQPSASAADSPDDELQQVREANPTSGEISAGAVTFTDDVPDSLRGAFLYTDPSQEGIDQANYQPPLCTDACLFKTYAFYSNTVSKQRFFLSLLAVGDNTLGGSFGYQTNNGNTHTNTTVDGLTKAASVIIQDLTYTADTAGVAGNNIAITYTSGGTAGAEVVTVVDSSISVQIADGVSTATQVKTAVDASGAAAALVNITISGTAGHAQTIQSETFLEDGFDTTYLNVGMRVVGSNITAGTTIVSVDSSSSITISAAASSTATVALTFEDVFRINSNSYYATTANNVANHEFKVTLDGTPSSNIQATALDLIYVVNHDSTNTEWYMYYLSGPDDLPGLMLIQERDVGGSEFILTSTNGESFSPVLQNSGSSEESDNDAKQNRVMISKSLQPEAVPILQFLSVGSENFPINRMMALSESIFLFKDDGIFKITGNNITNFQVTPFDSSTKLRAPEAAVVLNNQVFCFSDQGIVVVSETGVNIVSRPIETTLLEITTDQFDFFEDNSFAISYETDRKYIFYLMAEHDDQWPTFAYVYNTLTNTFTTWDLTRSSGIVLESDNKLYGGNPDDLYIYKERKTYTREDFADNEYTVTITAFDGTEVDVDDTTNIEVGDVIQQGFYEALITEVVDGTTITVNVEVDWTLGTATIFKAIATAIQWVPNTAANPGMLKHFSECTMFFKDASFSEISLGVQSSFDGSFDEVMLSAGSTQGWGNFPWGERPWGIGGGEPLPIRTYIPLEKQRASWINFRVECQEAFSQFLLTGISVQTEPMSSRFR